MPLQAVNNYQAAFESRVKKKTSDLQPATVAHRNFAKKKSKGTEGKRERIKG